MSNDRSPPSTMIYFERCFFLMSLIIAIDSIFSLTMAPNTPVPVATANNVSGNIIFGLMWIIVIAIPSLLSVLVSRRRSRIAKWIMIVFVVIGDLSVLGALFHPKFEMLVALIEMAPPSLGLYFLTRPASTDWLRH